jgi:hypothetical protein
MEILSLFLKVKDCKCIAENIIKKSQTNCLFLKMYFINCLSAKTIILIILHSIVPEEMANVILLIYFSKQPATSLLKVLEPQCLQLLVAVRKL